MNSTEQVIATALHELSEKSAPLAALIEQHGPYLPRPHERPDVFASLARSIIYQQLAGKAAASIHRRFTALFPGKVCAEALLALEFDTIRSAGLSMAKATAICDLAKHVQQGVLNLEELRALDDDELTQSLVRVRGIGPWTAQMFMMFQLGRLNVWPTGDLGVRRGYGITFCDGETPAARELASLGDPFEPYRSIVAWYCWRATDSAGPKA